MFSSKKVFVYRVPKALCNQSVQIVLNRPQQDLYGNHLENAPISISHCVFQLETIYSGSNNNRLKIADGSLYLYNHISTPFPDIPVDSTGYIIFGNQKYTITHISINNTPTKNEIWSYEILVNGYQS